MEQYDEGIGYDAVIPYNGTIWPAGGTGIWAAHRRNETLRRQAEERERDRALYQETVAALAARDEFERKDIERLNNLALANRTKHEKRIQEADALAPAPPPVFRNNEEKFRHEQRMNNLAIAQATNKDARERERRMQEQRLANLEKARRQQQKNKRRGK